MADSLRPGSALRVALALDGLSAEPTGIGRYIRELALHLSREVEELRFTSGGRAIAGDPLEMIETRSEAVSGAYSRFLLDRPVAARWAQNLLHLAAGLRPRDYRVDVVHGPKYWLPATRNARRIVTFHDLSVLRYPQWHQPGRAARLARAMEQVAPTVDGIITDSESVREEVIAHFGLAPDRVTAVPLGVDERFHPRPPDQLAPFLAGHGLQPGGYLLSVASFEPRKNLDRLLDAHRLLQDRKDHKPMPLVVIGGPGWRNEDLRRRLDEGVRQGWLLCPGYVAESDLPKWYAGARGFAYLSFYEGFGLPVLEAMACGVPVVVANRSAMPELAGSAGRLVDPGNLEEIAAALQQLIADDAWVARASAAGRKRAAEFTWERCAAETAAVYRRVMG